MGASGLHLGTRVSPSGSAACSGSDVLGSLGTVTQTSGFALGIGNGALPSEAGATESFAANLTFQG